MNRLATPKLGARFEIVRRLGEGAMGVVFEAEDRATNERVAVKVLRSFDSDAQKRFKREFRSLSDVQHPNLVRLHELFDDEDVLYFTMDLVEGRDLLDYVRAGGPAADESAVAQEPTLEVASAGDVEAMRAAVVRPDASDGPGFDEERLRSVLVQLTNALAALHDNGLLHRDVKPSNIVVTDDGALRLLDYGLVADPNHLRGTGQPIVGTAAYMAPEQTDGGSIGPEADFYAMGVLLFEALTGQLPFSGLASEVMVRKRLFDAPPPRALAVDLPSDLDALCEQLLARDPQARPSARQIAAVLGFDLRARVSHIAPRSILRQRASAFVGRAPEQAWLAERWAKVRTTRSPLAARLRGDSGVGKTSLVTHFLDGLAASDTPPIVLKGRCYASESVRYKGIDGIVDQLTSYLRSVRRDEVAALVPRHAAALIWQFPMFASVPELAHAPYVARPSDAHDARAQAMLALRELFLRLTDRHPVVVALDDAQWMDADGWAVLVDLLRTPEPPPILLLMTEVPGHPGRPPLPCEQVELAVGPLALADAVALAADYAEREGGASLDSAALAEEADGHPIFLFELVRHAATHDPSAARPRLEAALRERIEQLGTGERELLELACVAGSPLRLQLAASVAETEHSRAAASAESLRAASLFFTTGAGPESTVQPFHERVRATVLAQLDRPSLLSWHSRFATALERTAPDDHESIAQHWSNAGRLDRAAPHAAVAGRRALGAFAFDHAASLFRLSLQGTTEDRERQPLFVALGESLANSARGQEAARAFLDAARVSISTDNAFDLKRRAADQLLRSGHIDEGLSAIGDVLGEISMRAVKSPRGALASLLYHRARLAWRGLAFTERGEADIDPTVLRRIDVCWSIGTGLSLVDLIRGADFQTRSLLLALEAGDPNRVSRSLAMEAAIAASEGERGRRRVPALLAAAEALVNRSSRPEPLAWLTLVRACCASQEGRYEESYRYASEADVLLRERCTDTGWEMSNARAWALWSLASLGRLRELGERLPSLLRDCQDRRDRFGLMTLTLGPLHVVGLANDDTSALRRACEDGLGSWSQSGFHFQHMCGLFTMAPADLYDGDADGAAARVESSWRDLERALLLRVQYFRLDCWGLRGRVALAAAFANAKKAASRFVPTVRSAIRQIERERMDWSSGNAYALRAGLAQLSADSAQASALLEKAEEAFEKASMRMHVASARYHRGRLLSDDPLVSGAQAMFEAEGVKRPERFASTLVPFRT